MKRAYNEQETKRETSVQTGKLILHAEENAVWAGLDVSQEKVCAQH